MSLGGDVKLAVSANPPPAALLAGVMLA